MGGMNQDLIYAIRKARQRANESIDGLEALIVNPLVNGMANAMGTVSTGVSRSIANGETINLFGTQLSIGPGSIWSFSMEGIGSSEDKTETIAFEYKGQIKNIDGTTELIDTPFKLMEVKDGDVTVAITADDTNDCLKVNFTNSSGQTYTISVFIKLMKVD